MKELRSRVNTTAAEISLEKKWNSKGAKNT
jgi:hypothetical protein